ncbi:MAG: hypothetical protein ACK4GA_06740 [Acinetobacter sp.]|uniref:hypothetical protein n=1 Tax=Acinetobacter sp. TaxID=472 RepID=UPI0039196F61
MDNWVQTIVISLISGGFVGFITYLMKVRDQDNLKKKLRTYLYVEINQLYNHMNEVMNIQIQSKDGWFRGQIGTGCDLIFFNNEKIKEMLIDLNEEETLAIVSFYRFYTSMEDKLLIYSRHLQDKMNLQKQNRPEKEIQAAEELLIYCTQILELDNRDLKESFENIKKSEEFQLVQKKYELKEK